jgi:hypothetical protein
MGVLEVARANTVVGVSPKTFLLLRTICSQLESSGTPHSMWLGPHHHILQIQAGTVTHHSHNDQLWLSGLIPHSGGCQRVTKKAK